MERSFCSTGIALLNSLALFYHEKKGAFLLPHRRNHKPYDLVIIPYTRTIKDFRSDCLSATF